MKNAYVWRQEFKDDIDKLYEKCQTCLQFAKTPARPVVSLPMVNKFNPWSSHCRLQSTTENSIIFQGATLVNKHPPHTTPHLFWPRSGVLRSTSLTLVPTVQNKQGYHLGKWRGRTLRLFRDTAIQSQSNFPWIFLRFSNVHQTVIHTEMKLLKTYLVAEARVCEFGLFGG